MPERRLRGRGRSGNLCLLALLLVLLLSAGMAFADLPQITIEAEDYSEVTGGEVRVLDRMEASGGKCVSYWEEPGVALTCEFEVIEAGDYCLTLGYALNWPDTRREIRVDGEIVPGLEDVLLPTTGTWADFAMMTLQGPDGGRVRIPLEPGTHTLTLTNVDSRGLAWDAAILHDPETLMADVPLSDEELAEFGARLPETAQRLLLEGPGEDDLGAGDVAVAFSGGMPQAMRVGDVFFAVPREVAMPMTWQRQRVGEVVVATVGMRPEPGHTLVWLLATNGTSLLTVGAGTGEHTMAGGRGGAIPCPLIAWRDGRPWRIALEPLARALESGEVARALTIDGNTLSVNDSLAAVMIEDEVPWLEFGWPPVVNGDLKIVAGKVGPPLRPADTRIRTGMDGEDIIIHSSVDVSRALAQFYGIPQFEVRVHPDVSMTITTDVGETLELPAP